MTDADATLVALARYNVWATARVLAAAALLPDAALHDPAPGTTGTIARTIAHWLDIERWFVGLVDDITISVATDAGAGIAALTGAADAAADALLERCLGLTPDGTARRITRAGYDQTAHELLLQALTHSHQHRTQVAAAIDLRGVPVTRTDYIDFVMERGG